MSAAQISLKYVVKRFFFRAILARCSLGLTIFTINPRRSRLLSLALQSENILIRLGQNRRPRNGPH